MCFPNDPIEYIEGENCDLAAECLRAYYGCDSEGRRNFSGSLFETLAAFHVPDALTAEDLVAVTALGVKVPPRAAFWILKSGSAGISELLKAIPHTVPIWKEIDLSDDGPAYELWAKLKELRGVGAVIAGKLLAAKRPHSIPIWDQHVARVLGGPRSRYWESWQTAIEDRGGASVNSACADLRKVSGAPQELSVLRTLDVVIWMRAHGHRWIADPDLRRRLEQASL